MDADLDDAEIQAAIAASLGQSIDFQGEWMCEACTMLNQATLTKCHVCDTAKDGYVKDAPNELNRVCKNGHPLVYHAMTNKNAVCDLCDRKLVDASATFRCASCDYDTCWACHADGQKHMIALCSKLDSKMEQDRTRGPCPVAPQGPLGQSLMDFLQICLPRRDASRKDDKEMCVQFACVQQHNDASCGYYTLYHAKAILDVIKSRSEAVAIQAAAALRNGDRALEFVKVLHASLKRQKPDAHRVDLERYDAVELLDSHELFNLHKDDITLILDPPRMEAMSGGPANPSMVELDMKLAELRSGQINYHVLCFGAGGHYLTLVIWAVCKLHSASTSDDQVACASSTREYEIILFDSENRLNFQDAGNYKGLNEFVGAVSSCLRDGVSFIALEFQKAAAKFIDHTKKVVDKKDATFLKDCMDDLSFVREGLVLMDRMCSLKGFFQDGGSLEKERLRVVLQSLLNMIAAHIDPSSLGRATSSSRLLPLQRTESGTLWAQRFNDRLRELAADMVEIPEDLQWPPPVPLPPVDMVKSITACSFDTIDMDEARELIMAIAHIRDKRDIVTLQDQERAVCLVQVELAHRIKCNNGHHLCKAKREKAHCNFCMKDQILTSYLCKQSDCKYLCCASCYNRNRGSVLQACLRALTGGQVFLVGDAVRIGDTVGYISESNGRAYKVFGKWYHQDDVQEASVLPATLADAASLRLKKGYHVMSPSEHRREYSSIFGDNAKGTGHARSVIDSPQAWSAKTLQAGEWMSVDLGHDVVVVGVMIQGRKDIDAQFVTKFAIQYSNTGQDWKDLPGVFLSDQRGAELKFNEEFNARYIKFVVKEWHHHISMRAGVIVKASIMWFACNDVDCFPGQDADQMPAKDLEAVKNHAAENGWQVFVVFQGIAYFRYQSAQECFSSLKKAQGVVAYISTKVAT